MKVSRKPKRLAEVISLEMPTVDAYSNSTPLVHVLVINWNGRAHLEACFDSLLASAYSNARFVLIDNASEDGSVDFVRARFGSDSRVEILECPTNLGWSGGNNAGIRRAIAEGAEYVFLINNDTAVSPDFLERTVAAAQADPRIGVVAPKMVLFDQPDILNSVGLECSYIGSSWDKGVARIDAPAWDVPCEVIGACGGACLIRTAVFDKTGLLPEEFGIYLDDLDLCLRVWNAGYSIVSCPSAVVRHKFSATLGEGTRARYKYYLNTRNRFWMMLRNFPAAKLLRHAPALVLAEARAMGRGALNGEWWKMAAHAKAWAAAAGYIPQAVRERMRRRRQGQGACRFWRLIRTDRMFCPGALLPVDGWYPERRVEGEMVRPMACRAWMEVPSGRLRVVAINCYPSLGTVELRLCLPGGHEMELVVERRVVAEYEVTSGRLEVEGQRIFRAEDTGNAVDAGGWLRIEFL